MSAGQRHFEDVQPGEPIAAVSYPLTVYRLVKAGELRALQIGKSYRLREEDVDAFLASRFTEAG